MRPERPIIPPPLPSPAEQPVANHLAQPPIAVPTKPRDLVEPHSMSMSLPSSNSHAVQSNAMSMPVPVVSPAFSAPADDSGPAIPIWMWLVIGVGVCVPMVMVATMFIGSVSRPDNSRQTVAPPDAAAETAIDATPTDAGEKTKVASSRGSVAEQTLLEIRQVRDKDQAAPPDATTRDLSCIFYAEGAPQDQEQYVGFFKSYGDGQVVSYANALQQEELERLLGELKDGLSRPHKFQHWLAWINKIEVKSDGSEKVLQLHASLGMATIDHRFLMRVNDKKCIEALRNLDLPHAAEIDGTYKGEFTHDKSDGSACEWFFDVDAVRPFVVRRIENSNRRIFTK